MNHIIQTGDIINSMIFESVRHKDVYAPLHVNLQMEIILVSKGIVKMEISGKTYHIMPDEAVFVMPFEPHSFESETENCCHVLMFSAETVTAFFDFIKHNIPETNLFKMPCELTAYVDRILPNKTNKLDVIDAAGIISPLFCEIRRQCNFTKGEKQYDDIFLRALNIINAGFKESLSLESVAGRLNVNPATLSRVFSENAKIGFNCYVTALRCNHAAKLIKTSDASLTEIAYSSGFGTIRSFNRSFVKFFDCTPTQYKKASDTIPNFIKI